MNRLFDGLMLGVVLLMFVTIILIGAKACNYLNDSDTSEPTNTTTQNPQTEAGEEQTKRTEDNSNDVANTTRDTKQILTDSLEETGKTIAKGAAATVDTIGNAAKALGNKANDLANKASEGISNTTTQTIDAVKDALPSNSTTNTNSQYLVIGGSFSSEVNAQKKVKALAAIGFTAEVAVFNNSKYHSVIIGRYETKAEAESVASSLKSNHKVDCYVKKRQE